MTVVGEGEELALLATRGQAAAAASVGLAQSQWRKLESGKVELDLDSLIRIHAALGLRSFEELFGMMPSESLRSKKPRSDSDGDEASPP